MNKRKHNKEYYRELMEDLENLTDDEIIQKHGIYPRLRMSKYYPCRLCYLTYDFPTVSEWINDNGYDNFLNIVEFYKNNNILTTLLKYKIGYSFCSYIVKHKTELGLNRSHINKFPSKKEIIVEYNKCDSIEEFIRNVDNIFEKYIGNDRTTKEGVVSKIRRTVEEYISNKILIPNAVGGYRDNHSNKRYTNEEIVNAIKFFNEFGEEETKKKYGWRDPRNSLGSFCKTRCLEIKLKIKKHATIKDIEVAKIIIKDYDKMTIDVFMTKYGYENNKKVHTAISRLKKRFGITANRK